VKIICAHSLFLMSSLLPAGALNLNPASGVWTADAGGNRGNVTDWLGGIITDGSAMPQFFLRPTLLNMPVFLSFQFN
jgi:hypothetical protein